jgi:outer membrane protein assembly factor BamB
VSSKRRLRRRVAHRLFVADKLALVALLAPVAALTAPAAAAVAVAGPANTTTTAAPTTTASSPSWTVYHGDRSGTGAAASVAAVNTGHRAWTSPVLDGQLYGEPLAASGFVFVATEADTVYALSATTGAVVWSKTVGAPVPAGSLPCGNIAPKVGITGTPVVDSARGELFVVADEMTGGRAVHMLVGLDTSTGAIELTDRVDPSGSDPLALLQRTGLALDGGRVVFGFGGNYGDCSTYRGWVVSVSEDGGAPADFAVDAGPGQHEGAIWMGGGAPAVDASGHIWVSSGNGSVTSSAGPYDDSDAVLELSPSLQLLQFFAPTTWASDNAKDQDLSMEPVLLPDGQVVVAGKSRHVYLLDGARLGGIGGQQAELASACNDDIDGGSAQLGSTVFLPCLSGVVAVAVGESPPSLHVAWSSSTGGGPPIAVGLIWSLGQDGTLYGLDPATGAVRQQASVGAPANHFPTPGLGAGLLLAASATQVVAFHATAAASGAPTMPTAPASPTTTVRPETAGASPHRAVATAAGFPPAAVAGIVVGAVLLAAGSAWVLRRRHRRADGAGTLPPGT